MDGVAPIAHRNRDELTAAIPAILAAPKQGGRLEMILSRPAHGERNLPARVAVSAAKGVAGDHWSKKCWKSTDDGAPDPNVQICIMMRRVIEAIAGPRENWPPAGDNLIIDMDLTPSNTPPGTRLVIGSALLEVTEEPHNGCQLFIDRFGRDACLFVNTGEGKVHRFRGIYARVITDGELAVGDVVTKL